MFVNVTNDNIIEKDVCFSHKSPSALVLPYLSALFVYDKLYYCQIDFTAIKECFISAK